MRKALSGLCMVLCVLSAAFAAGLQNYAGVYTATVEGMTATLKLEPGKNGTVTGSLTVDEETVRLSGKVVDGEIVGRTTPESPEERAELQMHFSSGKLIVDVMVPGGGGAQRMVFTRKGSATTNPQNLTARKLAASPTKKRQAAVRQGPGVIVNGERLSEAFLRQVRDQFGVVIPPGKYWYDRDSGAWGRQGGPTAGITLANVNIGGRLRADASNGRSGTFLNGRELPTADIRAFARIGIIAQRGRFTCDAMGNIRREGEFAILFNVPERMNAVSAANRPRGYHRVTSSGYLGSDGQTSYFFDPQTGSSVMVGN